MSSGGLNAPLQFSIINLELALARLRAATPAAEKNARSILRLTETVVELTGGHLDLVRGTGNGSASSRDMSGEIPMKGTNGPERRRAGHCDIGSHAAKAKRPKKQKEATSHPQNQGLNISFKFFYSISINLP
jgi:hypothetical protein